MIRNLIASLIFLLAMNNLTIFFVGTHAFVKNRTFEREYRSKSLSFSALNAAVQAYENSGRESGMEGSADIAGKKISYIVNETGDGRVYVRLFAAPKDGFKTIEFILNK